MSGSPEGDQLELSFAQWCVIYPRDPWGGRSPRDLTRGHGLFILNPQGKKSVSEPMRDENQYDLWPTIEEGPFIYEGAPLLQDSLGYREV